MTVIERQVLAFINCVNEYNFKQGGIALPKFESLEVMAEFYKVMNEVFPAASGMFKDNLSGNESVTFDIPDRYKTTAH